jgi:hypothetical protein
MPLRKCEGKCGQSYDDNGEEPPAMPDDEVALFLCFGCSLSFTVFCGERGIEPPTPLGG